jgi:hypothetical protein
MVSLASVGKRPPRVHPFLLAIFIKALIMMRAPVMADVNATMTVVI